MGSVASRSIDQRNAARVLPDPVGATTSAFWPALTAAQAPACAAVAEANAPSNHARVAGEKASVGDTPLILTDATDKNGIHGRDQRIRSAQRDATRDAPNAPASRDSD